MIEGGGVISGPVIRIMLILAGLSMVAATGHAAGGRALHGEGGAQSSGPAFAPTDRVFEELQSALKGGDAPRIREVVDNILNRGRWPADKLLKAGFALAEREYFDQSARMFARCVTDYPDIFEGHYNLALAEAALGRPAEALAALERASPKSKNQESAYRHLRGKIFESVGRADAAERDLRAAFEAAPGEEKYALDLGFFYMRSHNYLQALAVMQQGVTANPKSMYVELGLAVAQFLAGHKPDSLETCRKLLQWQPSLSVARFLAGYVLYESGDLTNAEKVLASGLNSPDPNLRYLHVMILLKMHSSDFTRMRNELDSAVRVAPDCSACFFARGKVKQAQGEIEPAIADYQHALDLNPDFADGWFRLSILYGRIGEREKADEARRRFHAIKKESSDKDAEMIQRLILQDRGASPAPGTSQ